MTQMLTLLLTDVVDSTQLNSQLGNAAMAALWAAHDHQSRALMQRWRGREVGRSDGFLLLFAQAGDALGFAESYARSLRALDVPLQARIGIHTGEVELRQNSPADVARGAPLLEVDGLALPLAARLMAAARGGQTLVSADCRDALQSRMHGDWLTIDPGEDERTAAGSGWQGGSVPPIRLRLVSHGHWRLQGIEHPVELFQAGSEEDGFAPPGDSTKAYRVVKEGKAWRPMREVPGNLPAERDPFVGRASTLRLIAERFDAGARLLSLLGMGGVGKTRLALHHARTWLGEYPGGVWFCDLSAARSPEGILHAVAQALDVPMDRTDPVQLIGASIAARGRCLVILDNFEQLVSHAEATLGQWLQTARQARFMVTSREVLGIPGEHALLLEPLAVQEAQALLRERMAAAGADLPLAAEDVAAVAPLVELLDRLPLAIELAASRARVMRPAELLARMGQRFKLLAARTGRHDRQSTLRATLDWSWDLLSPRERSALAQLSVFEGGFTLPAAEAVLDLSSAASGTEAWVTDVLQALIEKSLVRRVDGHRFEMLRSVHDYASERLVETGDGPRMATMQRHWRYFGSLDERDAIAQRCIETDNLVTACRRATEAGALEAATDALVAAWAALNLTGPFRVAIELAEAIDRVASARAPQCAMTARWVAGSARYLAGDVTSAQRDLERAATSGGSVLLQARALSALGQVERSLGHLARAEELLLSGLEAAQATGHTGLICRAYNALGSLRLAQSRLDEAHHCFSTGLDTARAGKDRKQQVALLGNVGVVERRQGRDDAALAHYREALQLAQDIGDRRFEGNMRSNLGWFHLQKGQYELALAELRPALTIAQGTGLTRLAANVCCNLGLVAEGLGDVEAALGHHRDAIRLADDLKDALLPTHFRVYAGRLLSRMGRMGEASEVLQVAANLLPPNADPTVAGLLACAWAEHEGLSGELERCHQALAIATQHLEHSGASKRSELALELERLQAAFSSR